MGVALSVRRAERSWIIPTQALCAFQAPIGKDWLGVAVEIAGRHHCHPCFSGFDPSMQYDKEGSAAWTLIYDGEGVRCFEELMDH